MKKSIVARIFPLILLAALGSYCEKATAAELTKGEATKLLTLVGYKNVFVLAVLSNTGAGCGLGLAAANSPSMAQIIATGGWSDTGKPTMVVVSVCQDDELGWFYSNWKSGKFLVWSSKLGFKELDAGSAAKELRPQP